jgi:Bacterial SH3 domain
MHFSYTRRIRLCYEAGNQKTESPMLRLTLILCIGLFAALMIAGEDRGQLRPGLLQAATESSADSVAESMGTTPLTVITAEAPAAKPAIAAPVVASATPETVAPEPYVEPARELVTEVAEPVFSLASVGTESVPVAPQPEVVDGGAGTIWYVVANSVNVRAEPSTNAEVLGRLGSGEAALLVQAVDDDWARIVIQGDGVEGFVAMRYLSPEAP